MNDSILRPVTRIALAFLLVAALARAEAAEPRRVLSLDGQWQVAEGSMKAIPAKYEHMVPVPGLADMATPAFEAVGQCVSRNFDGSQFTVPDPESNGEKMSSHYREAFWYRRLFTLDGPVPAVALLKLNKAKYGVKVFINGKAAGEHLPCFTPGYFDLRPFLKGNGKENELIVRIGAAPYELPHTIPFGLDFEKKRYIPGIYDSVELILSGTPHIVRVQAAPEVTTQTVRVVARLANNGAEAVKVAVRFRVREAAGGARQAGAVQSAPITLAPHSEQDVDVRIPIDHCHLWSPEDPFLYSVEVDTGADRVTSRFGMRDFHFDPLTRRPMLNGKPYYLRGSNMCIFRFEEADGRGDKPWNEAWVRKLLKKYKSMNWNSGRICIGFPPELWYRLADEEGLLFQDEFPLWYPFTLWPNDLKSEELTAEFTEWMRERWNHPCLAIWDASNETTCREAGIARDEVRKLDLSNRPWDNSWNWTPVATDVYEAHAYSAGFVHEMNAYHEPQPGLDGPGPYGQSGTLSLGNTLATSDDSGGRPIIVNEYVWLWLNRDGSPSPITGDQWKFIMHMEPGKASGAERIVAWNRMIAEASEYLRSGRKLAGVHEFCFLSWGSGHNTPDHFTNYDTLELEPNYERMVREAFAPVGVSIDDWDPEYPAGQVLGKLPVVLVNDTYQDWKGPVTLSLMREGKKLSELSQEAAVGAVGRTVVTFDLPVPGAFGKYQIVAEIRGADGRSVHSMREFNAVAPAALEGLAVGRPAQASSVLGGGEARLAFDGDRRTCWRSEVADPQWIRVDLGRSVKLSRAKIFWGREYARAYTLEASSDAQTWQTIHRQEFGPGGIEEYTLPPVAARFVRLTGTEQGARFGYSIRELQIFGEEAAGAAAPVAERPAIEDPNQKLLKSKVNESKKK